MLKRKIHYLNDIFRNFLLVVATAALLLSVGCGGSSNSSREELQADFSDPELPARLSAAFESWAEARDLVGASINVSSDDFNWDGTSGLVSEGGTKYQPTTQQRVGSITKTMTSVIILQLIEQNLLSLDTTMDNYFPDYPNAELITIEHLLTHRSGIYDVTLDDRTYQTYVLSNPEKWITVDEILLWTYDSGNEVPSEINSLQVGETIPRGPACDPGACFHYSQPAYQVLGRVIETLTGKSLETVYEERIFSPLGMANSYIPTEDQADQPIGHTNLYGLLENRVATNQIFTSLNGFNSSALAAGGAISTSEDLMKFIRGLLEGSLLSETSMNLMQNWQDYPSSDESVERQYGLGLTFSEFDNVKEYSTIGHGGSVPGSGSKTLFIQELDVYVTVTRNTDVESTLLDTPILEELVVSALLNEEND